MRHIIWRNRASAILGLLIMIMPFTGFPESLRTALIVLFGLLIVIFGFSRESASGYSYNQELPETTEPEPSSAEEVASVEKEIPQAESSPVVSENSFVDHPVVKRRRTRKPRHEEIPSVSTENQFDAFEPEEKNS